MSKKSMEKSKRVKTAKRKPGSLHPAGSAAASNNTNLWRQYRLTYVTVTWQERYGGRWHDHSKQIPYDDFVKHYSQMPPNDQAQRRRAAGLELPTATRTRRSLQRTG